MMNRATERRGFPGMNVMLALVAALIAFGILHAMKRTSHVDDSAIGAASRGWPDMRIDVNAATVSELSLLPGLGDRLAQRIIDDRSAHGPFATIDDLGRVSGMGAATIARLKPYAFASQTESPVEKGNGAGVAPAP